MKKRGITVNLSDRWLYSLIGIFALFIFLAGVYAFGSNGVSHAVDEIIPPAGCQDGQALVKNGESWACADIPQNLPPPPSTPSREPMIRIYNLNYAYTSQGCFSPSAQECYHASVSPSIIDKDDWNGTAIAVWDGNYKSFAFVVVTKENPVKIKTGFVPLGKGGSAKDLYAKVINKQLVFETNNKWQYYGKDIEFLLVDLVKAS